MKELNEHIEFLEMAETDPQLLVWLLELRRHREDNWKQRAEAAEAKLAELEKQASVPAAFMVERNAGDILYPSKCRRQAEWDAKNLNGNFYELFTRPAPAVSLAELVPGEITYELAQTHCHRNDRPDITHGFHYGANWMRATILRNIEQHK